MSAPNLTVSAASSAELFSQLRSTDITVPLVTEGRKKEHREQYMMARFLATTARAGRVTFPLDLVHREKPDFLLRFGSAEIGVECVEAVPEELYEIEILREKHYPEAMNFGQMFLPGERAFNWDQKHQIASGNRAGPPWMPKSARRNWIAAMEYFVRRKTEKLREGNYASNTTTWLLIQDEWPTSLGFYPQQLREAAAELACALTPLLSAPSFQAIFIASNGQLLCFESGQMKVEEIFDLWN